MKKYDLIIIWKFIMIVYLFSLFLDLGMTYLAYKIDFDYFWLHELNYHLKEDIRRGIPFFRTMVFSYNIFLISFIAYPFRIMINQNKKTKINLFIISVILGFYYCLAYINLLNGSFWFIQFFSR